MTKSMLRRIAALIFAVIIVAGTMLTATAQTSQYVPYENYTYWEDITGVGRKLVYNRPMYDVEKVLSSTELIGDETEIIGELVDVCVDKNGNVYLLDTGVEGKAGAKIIAVSSSYWQNEIPQGFRIRHSSGKNLFDFADVCIDDYNPVGDTAVNVEGFDTPIAPISNIVDFYIAHRLEIETVRLCVEAGIEPPVWRSANTPGGDEFNKKNIDKYKPRIKML